MEGFIHIVNKNNLQFLNEDNYKNIINEYKNVNHFFKIMQKDNILGIYYTNESPVYPYQEYPNNLFCPVGQFVNDKDYLQSILINSDNTQKIEVIKKLSGAFSLSYIDFNLKLIHVFTHIVRAESVFSFENEEKIIIGSDPLLVSVFSNENHTPAFDSSKFISFFEQGYFADDSSPYKNVFCLPENSHIKIGENISITQIDNTYETAFSYDKSEDLLEEITNNFLNAFQIMPNRSAPILSGLTGGKDSRVILLALLANHYNVNTHTTGFKDHPDVVVAKLLAERLNVPHKINDKKLNKDNQLIINLEDRLLNITKASSGMLSAYDNVTTKTQFNNQNNFNGVAASVITGGFNKFNHNTDDSIETSLKKAVYKFDDFYIDKDNYFSKYLENFAQKSNDYKTLLHLFFLINRTGRWTSDSRIPKSYATNSFSIFLDNQLTKSAMKLNMYDLRSEIIHYKLIEKLNKDVLNIPFANQRFEFEKNGPASPEDYENWLARTPVFAQSKVGSYNWRSLGNNDQELVNAFKEIILSSPNNAVFDNLNYQKIEILLNSKLQNRTNKFLWAIASMIKYTDHMKQLESFSNIKIKLNTPQDSLLKVKIPSEIVDLTYDYRPLNDSINYEKDTKVIHLIPNEKNPYLKTYKGGFNTPADSVDISSVKNILFETSITIDKHYTNLKFYIMFYTLNKRFKTFTIEPKLENDQLISFKQKISVPKEASSFRTAIHFKDKLNSEHTLNYSYAKLIY